MVYFHGWRRLMRFRVHTFNKYSGVIADMSIQERLHYYTGIINVMTGEVTGEMQEIQRAAIPEGVSVMFIHECADKLTAAEAKALNQPGVKIPVRIQMNAKRSALYYVEAKK